MIYNFFYFKEAINLIDNCGIIYKKIKTCPINIFLHNSLYRISIKTLKSLLLQKNVTRKMIKISYSPKFEPNIGEVAYSERTKAH